MGAANGANLETDGRERNVTGAMRCAWHIYRRPQDAAPGTGHHSSYSVPAEEQGAGREGPGTEDWDASLREDSEDGLAQADGSKSVSGGFATQSPRCRLWAENFLSRIAK